MRGRCTVHYSQESWAGKACGPITRCRQRSASVNNVCIAHQSTILRRLAGKTPSKLAFSRLFLAEHATFPPPPQHPREHSPLRCRSQTYRRDASDARQFTRVAVLQRAIAHERIDSKHSAQVLLSSGRPRRNLNGILRPQCRDLKLS